MSHESDPSSQAQAESAPSPQAQAQVGSAPNSQAHSSAKRKRDEAKAKQLQKKARRLTPEESATILSSYAYHKKNWEAFWRDPKVKAINASESHIKSHIEYKKGVKNRKLSGENRGAQERAKILEMLEGRENGEQVDLTLEEPVQHEERDTPQTPEFSDSEKYLHEVEKEALSSSVDSVSLSSQEDFNRTKLMLTERQQKKNMGIRNREQERRGVLQEVREQRSTNSESQETRNNLVVLLWQQQQQHFEIQQQQQHRQHQQEQQHQQMLMTMFCKALQQNFPGPPKDFSST